MSMKEIEASYIEANEPTFQSRVGVWVNQCFGVTAAGDKTERNYRFIEEALELVQACGCSKEDVYNLVEYVFNRPAGEPTQEIGGTMTTLAALCNANGFDMKLSGEKELNRMWSKIEQIREKQANKPINSSLPQ